MLQYTEENLTEINTLSEQYPDKKSLTLPLLHLSQKEFGHVSSEVIDLVAKTVGLSYAHVEGVATFYTMYDKKKIGKFHFQMCCNIGCFLNGSDEYFEYLSQKTGIKNGETTDDGAISITKVECLGACGNAVVLQVNDDYHENITKAKIDELIDTALTNS